MKAGAKHTPGPWNARIQRSRAGQDLGWIVEFSNGRIAWACLAYADTNDEAKKDDPAREANAHLIEAAPELLEACEASLDEMIGLRAYLTTCDPTVLVENIDSVAHKMNEVRLKVEAAIQKAKGEAV